MTTLDLKKTLIHRISEINDILFLKAIKTILDSKTETEILTLTREQKDEIIASKKEIEQGLFFENEKLESEVKTWLNVK
ncbi:MAG: hypothetical protein HGB12_09035 [Bacteroidetes bacterium]|nr:hypothetical protein [Bacteroidota bacterium]